jgi:hypothetical protein
MGVVQYDFFELLRRAGWPEMADDLAETLAENPDLASPVELDSEVEARVAALEAVRPWPVYDPRDYGAVCDGATDDTTAWQALTADVLGAATLQEGGRVFMPGPSKVSDTIEFRKFSGELFGDGWGRGGGAFLWDGPADIPVLRLRESQGAWLHDFRVTGTDQESQLPSALVEMYNWLGLPEGPMGRDAWSNAHNKLERLWLGAHNHEGTRDESSRNGLVFTGNNTNNDHNTIQDCKIYGGQLATGAAIRQEGSQNILNKYVGGGYGGFPIGLDTNATVTMYAPDFVRCSDVDINMRQGQKLHVTQWHSEHSGGFLRMEGGHVIVDQATWQCYPPSFTPSSSFDGRVIENTGSANIELRNVLFGLSRLQPDDVANWRISLGDAPSVRLLLDGVNLSYGGVTIDESNVDLGSGYRVVEGYVRGGRSFRNVVKVADDVLSFDRFDGSS